MTNGVSGIQLSRACGAASERCWRTSWAADEYWGWRNHIASLRPKKSHFACLSTKIVESLPFMDEFRRDARDVAATPKGTVIFVHVARRLVRVRDFFTVLPDEPDELAHSR
ncbi:MULTISPECIES: hypothetical protein [Burkholderia cepacia complex]|uniref:hypothetical protein n=1 Tax=Burkholderia cepacia complex TaxID=87882 RepID=UPI0013DDBB65|nr:MULTISPECIES: hypothetical protein [Burkholderia cepacia complex]